MNLAELLTKITPLPWKLGEPNPVKIADSVYCTHAANVLPELVEALQEIISENPTPTLPYGFRVNAIANAAIARAELVEPSLKEQRTAIENHK